MPAIHQQKREVRNALEKVVMGRYDNTDEEGKRAITRGLFTRLCKKMTLRELQTWHEWVILTQKIRERGG